MQNVLKTNTMWLLILAEVKTMWLWRGKQCGMTSLRSWTHGKHEAKECTVVQIFQQHWQDYRLKSIRWPYDK